MKKILILLLSLILLVGCSSKDENIESVVIKDEGANISVIFNNAKAGTNATFEFGLEESYYIGVDHELEEDSEVEVSYVASDGSGVMNVNYSKHGEASVYIPSDLYKININVVNNTNGTIVFELRVIEDDVSIENPWSYSEEISDAIKATGINLDVLSEEVLPGDVQYYYSFYTSDIIQTNYGSENNELYIRVSKQHEGKTDLAGDWLEYPSMWEESLEGMTITCYGEEDNIHLATYTNNSFNYAISYNTFSEGAGLTLDELFTLIYNIKAS